MPDIVAKDKVAHVLGLLLAGFSVSSVIGVPIGTMLAGAFGWKAAYVCVFALGIVVSAALLPALPRTSAPAQAVATLRSQLRLLTDGRTLANIVMVLAGAASTYVFYTYLDARAPGRHGAGRRRRQRRALAVRRGMRGLQPAVGLGGRTLSGCARCP